MGHTVILGANGQLGSDLCREWASADSAYTPLRHADIDVCDEEAVRRVLVSLQPKVVINTAAFHKVEACEEDPERAFAVNAFAVLQLARSCHALGIRLVHFSTDYVFSGDAARPYAESAAARPVNAYGWSKATGEYFLRRACPEHLLIRTSGLFGIKGASGKGGNFVETMLRLGQERGTVSVVTDQTLSPTYTRDLAIMVRRLIDDGATGTFHVTNSGASSWYEFAQAIFERAGLSVTVLPITTDQSGARVARPGYSVLGSDRLQREGYGRLRSWREAVTAYLSERAMGASVDGQSEPIAEVVAS